MASKKSAANPHQWPDGSWHSVPWVQHVGQIQGNAQANTALMNAGRPGFAGLGTPGYQAPTISPGGAYPSLGAPAAASPQPVDPSVANAALIANRNVAIGKGEAAYQQGNLGFDLGYNPDGSVNTANPYSRAALLQLSHEHDLAGANTSYAAQGQLYSGAYGRAKAGADRNYGQAEAANRTAFQRGTHSIQTGLLNTFGNAGTGVSDTDFAALLRATYPGS